MGSTLEGSQWAQRKQQQQWKDQAPILVQQFIDSLPQALDLDKRERLSRLLLIQARLDSASDYHLCPQLGSQPWTFKQVCSNEVTYLGALGTLTVPTWQCECCHDVFSPHPASVGCFPSTPTQPSVWYEVKVHQLYQRFGLLEGLSATAYLSALQRNHEYWTDESKVITVTGYEDSFCGFLTLMTDLEQLSNLGFKDVDIGPFSDCPICAPGGEPYPRSIAIDAFTKCNHFRKCGMATRHIPPNLNSFFSPDGAEAEVRELEGQGKLSLSPYISADSDGVGIVEACNTSGRLCTAGRLGNHDTWRVWQS